MITYNYVERVKYPSLNLKIQSQDVLNMVKKGFPPISKPLPVLLQGPKYEDHPLVTRPKETSTFETTSSTHSWLYSIWTNIFSAKWAGNLLPSSISHDSSVTHQTSEPSSRSSEPVNVPKPKPLLSSSRRPGSGKLLIIAELYYIWLKLHQGIIWAGMHEMIHGEKVVQEHFQIYPGSVGRIGVKRIFYKFLVKLHMRQMCVM
jgi:hypothetical protein